MHKTNPPCAKTKPTRGACRAAAKVYSRKGSNYQGKKRHRRGTAQAWADMTLEQRRRPEQEVRWRKRGHKRRRLSWTTAMRWLNKAVAKISWDRHRRKVHLWGDSSPWRSLHWSKWAKNKEGQTRKKCWAVTQTSCATCHLAKGWAVMCREGTSRQKRGVWERCLDRSWGAFV